MEDLELCLHLTAVLHRTAHMINYFYCAVFIVVRPFQQNPKKMLQWIAYLSRFRKIDCCRCSTKYVIVGYIHVQYSMLHY